MLKAHVVKRTEKMPPKIHNLIRLAEIAQLQPSQGNLNFMARFGLYQLEGRYPDVWVIPLDTVTTKEKLVSAMEILEWLKTQFVFGAEERAKVDTIRNELSAPTLKEYDQATTYHDGKWLLLTVDSDTVFEDVERLLAVKRKPKIKQ